MQASRSTRHLRSVNRPKPQPLPSRDSEQPTLAPTRRSTGTTPSNPLARLVSSKVVRSDLSASDREHSLRRQRSVSVAKTPALRGTTPKAAMLDRASTSAARTPQLTSPEVTPAAAAGRGPGPFSPEAGMLKSLRGFRGRTPVTSAARSPMASMMPEGSTETTPAGSVDRSGSNPFTTGSDASTGALMKSIRGGFRVRKACSDAASRSPARPRRGGPSEQPTGLLPPALGGSCELAARRRTLSSMSFVLPQGSGEMPPRNPSRAFAPAQKIHKPGIAPEAVTSLGPRLEPEEVEIKVAMMSLPGAVSYRPEDMGGGVERMVLSIISEGDEVSSQVDSTFRRNLRGRV
mmetsp:Transcript_18972/g.50321  ORF Transcript_18972/g.50321 Transcript_18972/m.50321 type:complete len:347 (-) Transcript_18972:107-1147(-)|eukprot:CAMPEP_0184722298 /NCGR_PEP_ID=MMETSP0314-20130426/21696_1 /TAXON_ID=38298 /ORGANISM="Rhodella maculata, Strain CCMP 736" /LENGTH=346 /DNA_ID=CAMNT_0027186863 /DNA_START=197 /DNA_END=1237 /DNA_ORIENTATION=+